MTLTALCVCGTLLALSGLSRITAEEGVLLGEQGFGPCVVTLSPAGACRQEEHDNTCPFHINLPPLVVHLPQHLLELENILQDLEKIKDSVDELREMCADCKGSPAGRKRGRKSEEDLNGGKSMHDYDRDQMNERLEEKDRNFGQECGKDGVKEETMDGDNNMEKRLNEQETERIVKDIDAKEPATEVAGGEDPLKELKTPTSDGNMQTVNVTREKTAETNPIGRRRTSQDDMLEKYDEKTREESSYPMWLDKTKEMEKNTKDEAFDRIKMSKNHTVNVNKEQGEAEMEKGIKVDPNKKKPKQMERFGLTEKSREIKTESEQRDCNGETSSSKITENADILSISQTRLTTGLTSSLDWGNTKSFTSSLPSPSLLSSTLSAITDVASDPKAGCGLTGSTESGAAGVTEPQGQDMARLSTTTEIIVSLGGPAERTTGLNTRTPTTTSPLQSLFITSSPRVIDRSHGAQKKNILSRTSLKPPPVQAPKAGEKPKSGIKSEAEERLKNVKTEHKLNQGPLTQDKTKLNQKQRPQKPTSVKPKPGKDLKPIQNKKPGQKTAADISSTEKNLKQILMHKQKLVGNTLKPKQNSSASVQRPAAERSAVNATYSGKYALINRTTDTLSNTDQTFKLEKQVVQLFITEKYDQDSDERVDSKEKLNETFELRQNPNKVPNPTVAANHFVDKSIPRIQTINPKLVHNVEYESTQKPEQKSLNESVSRFEENIKQKKTTSPDLTPGLNLTTDRHDNMNDFTQEHPKPSQDLKTETSTPSTESVNNPEENSLQEPKSNPDLTPALTSVPAQATVTPDQQKNSNQDHLKAKNKPETTRESSSESNKRETSTKLAKQTVLIEPINKPVKNPSHDSKSNPDFTPEGTYAPNQHALNHDLMNKSSQAIPAAKHKHTPIKSKTQGSETTASPKPGQNLLTRDKTEENPLKKSENPLDLKPKQNTVAHSTFHHMNKSMQEDRNPVHQPETNREYKHETSNKSDEQFISNPHLTPDHTSALDQATKNPDQKTKSSEDHLKDTHKPENIQGFKSNKKETANTKSSIRSVGTYEEKSWQEPKPNPGVRPAHSSTTDLTTTTPDQIKKSTKTHFKDKPNPENIQEFKSNKTETATQKQDREPLSLSVDQSENFEEHTAFPDLTPRQTSPPNLATTILYKMTKSRQSEMATQETLTESKDKFQGKSLQEPRFDAGLPPQQTSNVDSTTKKRSALITPKHNPEQKYDFTSNKGQSATQKPKSEENSWEISKAYSDLAYRHKPTPGQATRTSDEINIFSNEYLKTQTSKEFKFNKAETASQNPSWKTWTKSKDTYLQGHRPTLDLPTAIPNQMKTSTNSHLQNEPYHDTKLSKNETGRLQPLTELWETSEEASMQESTSYPSNPNFNEKTKSGQEPRQNQNNPTQSLKTRPYAKLKSNQTQHTNPRRKTPSSGLRPNLKPVSMTEKILKANYNKTSRPSPPLPQQTSNRPIQRPKEALKPELTPETKTDPPKISWVPSGNIQNSPTDMPPTSGLVKQIAEMSHTPGETEFSASVKKTITLSPKTSNSLENGYFPAIHTHPKDVTSSPNSRITSDLRPQTAGLPSSVPTTTPPSNTNHEILRDVIPSTGPGSTQPSVATRSKANTSHSPNLETFSTHRPIFRPKPYSTSAPKPLTAERTTPSPRELRVKINQVAAFVNTSLTSKESHGRTEPERKDSRLPSTASTALRDCSDLLLRGRTRSGLYLVTPDLRSSSFQVFCDMELDGGGWTLLQRRRDGSVSFNRSWAEYQAGFGVLDGGEFWLGNHKMHLLTRDRDVALRVELEDFDGVSGHAHYERFRVASERLRYRLTVGGYTGTAGDALRFSKTYDHNNRAFTTPDRDNDRYPSGNCGAYYSSGWWFDACMAANLNGRYHVGRYRGVRDGIFWGTWHNISTEYYPTNERQSFKSVRMMMRPHVGPR